MIRYAIDNPLITNMMLVVILLVGVLSWYAMPQEMFPVTETDRVNVRAVYEGASPEEVERQVTIPIEEVFDGLADIDTLLSTSGEGLSNISIKLKPGTDVDSFLDEARLVLDRVIDLPEDVEKPEIRRVQARFPVISVSVSGEVAPQGLYQAVEDVRRRLLQIPGVASAQPAGKRDWEMWVEVRPEVLATRGVALNEISRALRAHLTDVPGGTLQAAEGDILLRGNGVAPQAESIGQIPLRRNADGGILRLGQVAKVELRHEEARTLARFNGRPSVNITVTKTADASTIAVAKAVYALADQMRAELPTAIQLGVFSDMSVYVKNRLNTVKSSGLVGLVLVLLSLYLFLNFRIAAITALGIPVSFLFAVIAMNYLGHTINMVSLFAFLIALGMIVDDAIIVTENIYRHMEAGMAPREAALKGSREVMWPVIVSTATTVAAFLPVFAIGGTMGAFIAVIPVVVACALIGSLWEAFAVLPSHATHMLKVSEKRRGWIAWDKGLQRYLAVLRWSLRNRYFVAIGTVGLLTLVLVFAVTRMPFQLFGHVETGQFFINVEAPNTYSLEDSSRLAADLEREIFTTIEPHELRSVLTNVGVVFIDFNTVKFDSKHIQFIIDLSARQPQGLIETWVSPLVSLQFLNDDEPVAERERATEEIIDALRERLVTVPGMQRLSILRPQGGPAGADIEVGVSGTRMRVLQQEADEIADYLKRMAGVHDVRLDTEAGKLEYRYQLNERGRQLGITQLQLAEAVRIGFQGQEVVHINWQDERIPVRLIYDDEIRASTEAFARLPLVIEGVGQVFLSDVAEIAIGRGFSTIQHRDQQRLVTITAEVDSNVTTPNEVTTQLEAQFKERIAVLGTSYELVFLGQKRETSESMKGMINAALIALGLIFFMLTALFRSLLDPLVVMIAIPMGLVGAVLGHLILGAHIEFLSVLGFLALAGIVVNDSLILIDFAKRMRDEGWQRVEAMIEAGRVRIRPILLTSITTFLGVSPLIFFATGQAAFLSPMAISLGFGLLFATALILLVLPCYYLIADDIREVVCGHARRLFNRPAKERNAQ